jgi:hypothetical protein
MDSAKREWLLGGLGLADGVGLVSPLPEDELVPGRQPIVQPGGRFALFGDALATGLAVSLMPLTKGANVRLHADGRGGRTALEWLEADWLLPLLEGPLEPLLGVFAWGDVVPTRAMFGLERQATERGRPLIWVAPPAAGIGALRVVEHGLEGRPHRLFRSDGLSIPLGPDNIHPTVRGYAGWAGALWDWLTSV